MSSRPTFAYVVGIDGGEITLNLRDEHRGQLVGHREGVAAVGELGALFGVVAGPHVLVLRVRAIRFAEAAAIHKWRLSPRETEPEPLRHLVAIVLGYIASRDGVATYEQDALRCPALGAEAVPLTDAELKAIRSPIGTDSAQVLIGTDVKSGAAIRLDLTTTLSRHVAVLGSTGQGKSCLTAAVLQQLIHLPRPRVVIFDINGEYSDALLPHDPTKKHIKVTTLGGKNPTRKIPYYAFGRHGLGRMLLPSEKTQRPALNFALEAIAHVEYVRGQGTKLADASDVVFFDDCRPEGADKALEGLIRLRAGKVPKAAAWPSMYSLAALVAESHATRKGKDGKAERNAFEYGNVSPLVTRIRRCAEDPLFRSVIDVFGGPPTNAGALDWSAESTAVVEDIFGGNDSQWKIHIVNVRDVVHDLMPMVLGGMLELLAFELFQRGPGGTHPTLLVLEEAHNYLRPIGDGEETSASGLAYERLAKEGRKFGVGLWLSTQRPSEISPTVLGQCGTWVVFRLIGESDVRAVTTATEWIDDRERQRIMGLPRQQALVFGSSLRMPTRVQAPEARPRPKSDDPRFAEWSEERD